ncbi:MAG: F0F1 ATP synthase subunit epsilon [Gemmatimonadetes bacterium]|jgi:F-type H+-transporting ATPase subunit epsilon|nr:F0F1 ATP synthase subunit epsilon [Gemmatimonadota bacterium]MBT5325326.1 F0F1 ATP synthase subunit epsilon [Gemmatimonadota bacterium]MBT5449180.1 F0F1 ATP synthase subunit epsilon [Gemmatimonadota bacterium]MBT5801602.1 F0F1 ATP synthase subunit epsilon [Gemmatimonadota bacterium]MBT6621710.1 F0F1 ATP synthase subunit epsilon [Gemmatimonadota bacterium]|tara:strand:- start:48 stop:449 length:402 start_codon:yes stop_codon:yes gene_type:complete
MAGFALEIVTPEKTVYSGQIVSLQAPGSEGSFGIMAGHMPLLTSLQIGALRFAEEGGNEAWMAVSGGFAEVGQERVTILAETAERADEIDVVRAESSRQRAEERLASREQEDVDVVRAQMAISRALNRLKVGG